MLKIREAILHWCMPRSNKGIQWSLYNKKFPRTLEQDHSSSEMMTSKFPNHHKLVPSNNPKFCNFMVDLL